MCRAFILQHYLPIVFAVALAWALAFPAPGQAVVGITVSLPSVITLMGSSSHGSLKHT